ncbi:MAG: site-specific DNA-methyltransferase [Candidatus Coatesbacteria bacterium]|nr:site-specific DNA-methyltransferase [Candidatus Coatesbacteria bacterium]
MPTTHRIIFGDSRRMAEIPDESVHLVVTSPPYWQLKDYGGKGQIGFDDTYEDYINGLNLVWKECERVLHKGCRLCVNIGDQFARAAYYGRYKVIPIRTEIVRMCEALGLDYMGAIVWQKVTTCNTTGGASIMGSYPYPRNGIIKLDYEFIVVFKKLGEAPEVSDEAKKASELSLQEWNDYFYGHWNFPGERIAKGPSGKKTPRPGLPDVPSPFGGGSEPPAPGSPFNPQSAIANLQSPIRNPPSLDHIAPFPEELPKRLIRMFSFVGDTVLDPFIGSGTTTLAANNLNRNSIGCEINPDYRPLIEQKVGARETNVFGGEAKFEFVVREAPPIDLKAAVKALPYVFKDVVQITLKVDPRKKTYGSRIKAGQAPDEELRKVKRITGPSFLELTDETNVHLIGYRPIAGKEAEVTALLESLSLGQKVYLRESKRFKFDDKGRLLAYVYLEDDTFVNAELIKSDLVEIDTMYE